MLTKLHLKFVCVYAHTRSQLSLKIGGIISSCVMTRVFCHHYEAYDTANYHENRIVATV